jgi:hypothetical protein
VAGQNGGDVTSDFFSKHCHFFDAVTRSASYAFWEKSDTRLWSLDERSIKHSGYNKLEETVRLAIYAGQGL